MTQTLSVRNTHTYVGAYAHLDAWTDIGSYTIRSSTNVVDEEDLCETTQIMLEVVVDSDAPSEAIAAALRDSLSHSGCAHEHDCCGCWSTYVQEVTQQGDAWIVTQSASRNY